MRRLADPNPNDGNRTNARKARRKSRFKEETLNKSSKLDTYITTRGGQRGKGNRSRAPRRKSGGNRKLDDSENKKEKGRLAIENNQEKIDSKESARWERARSRTRGKQIRGNDVLTKRKVEGHQ